MSKKPFSTQVDGDVYKAFSKKCRENNARVTDITEALLYLYANDKIQLEKRVTYEIKEGEESSIISR